MVTDLVYRDIFIEHEMSRGHPESPERLRSAMNAISNAGLLNGQKVNLLTPKKAPLDEVYALHGKAYLEGIRAKSEKGGGMYTMDTSVNSYTYDAALFAAGGGIDAVDRVMATLTRARVSFVVESIRPPYRFLACSILFMVATFGQRYGGQRF